MSDRQEQGAPLVDPQVLQRFEERIAADLVEQTLVYSPEELRHAAAALLPRCGSDNLYEILGVSVGAGDAEIHGAYTRLGRRVHPSLANRIGVHEGVLRILFEHATHAYLVLSDPDRRKDYDREHQVRPDAPPVDPEATARVRREIAQSSYKRARSAMLQESFHTVVELLRDSVHWDPRPEVHALLGEAQAKNPNWRDEAVENLQTAIGMAPRESAYRLKLAQIYEEMERVDDAVAEYRDVLQKRPNQPDAQAALERLGAAKR